MIFGIGSSAEGRAWMPVLLPAAHLLLLPFLLRNLSLWGVRLVLLGLVLNLTAMAANGGLMPVAPSTVEAIGRHDVRDLRSGDPIPGTKNILLEPDQIRAQWLSDAIVLPVPRPFKRAVSAGDLLVAAGVATAFVEIARRHAAAALATARLEVQRDG